MLVEHIEGRRYCTNLRCLADQLDVVTDSTTVLYSALTVSTLVDRLHTQVAYYTLH